MCSEQHIPIRAICCLLCLLRPGFTFWQAPATRSNHDGLCVESTQIMDDMINSVFNIFTFLRSKLAGCLRGRVRGRSIRGNRVNDGEVDPSWCCKTSHHSCCEGAWRTSCSPISRCSNRFVGVLAQQQTDTVPDYGHFCQQEWQGVVRPKNRNKGNLDRLLAKKMRVKKI